MAAKQKVQDIAPGHDVASVFVVRRKRLTEFKNKDGKYLALTLADNTGEIDAKVWERAEELSAHFREEDVIFVHGKADEYRGVIQLTLSSLRLATELEYNPEDFLRQTSHNVDQLMTEIQNAIEGIKRPHLKILLSRFFDDPEFLALFRRAPAAKTVHHAYLGGLAEHIAHVVEICLKVAEIYPEIDRDLLLTTGILHDIGKLRELRYALTIRYSDEGQMIGHTVIGERIVAEQMDKIPGFPESDKILVRHIILSHHGQHDYGAPILPQCLEACALHHAENLDAQINRFVEITRQQRDPEKAWTERDNLLNRTLYTGKVALEIEEGWG